jgi:hypothetical protein
MLILQLACFFFSRECLFVDPTVHPMCNFNCQLCLALTIEHEYAQVSIAFRFN